eukprot:5849010-Prymnesium_polylepis.1
MRGSATKARLASFVKSSLVFVDRRAFERVKGVSLEGTVCKHGGVDMFEYPAFNFAAKPQKRPGHARPPVVT